MKNAWKTRYTRGKTNLSDILPGQVFSFQKCRQQKDRNSMKYFTNKLGDRITNIRTNSTNNQLIEKNSKPLNRKIFYVSRFTFPSYPSECFDRANAVFATKTRLLHESSSSKIDLSFQHVSTSRVSFPPRGIIPSVRSIFRTEGPRLIKFEVERARINRNRRPGREAKQCESFVNVV